MALLSDSANAESPYPNANEHEIYDHIKETFEYQDGRIIVAGVASNIQRIQQVINAAASLGRRVVLTGRDVEKVVKTAIRMGYIKLPNEDVLAKTKELKALAPEKTVILKLVVWVNR